MFYKRKNNNRTRIEIYIYKKCRCSNNVWNRTRKQIKIKVIGYNEIADKCYKELEKEDIIWIEGRIEEKQIVIKELVKNKNKNKTWLWKNYSNLQIINEIRF